MTMNKADGYDYQNLAHVQLCYGNETEAFILYQQSLALWEDKTVFFQGCEDDYKYLALHGVSREKYDEIIVKLSIV
jgi:hypothetical protein